MGLVHHLIIATVLKIHQLCAIVYLLMLIFFLFLFLNDMYRMSSGKTQCIWVNKDCLATTADQLIFFFQLCCICLHFDTLWLCVCARARVCVCVCVCHPSQVLIGHIKKKMNKQTFLERCSLCQAALPFSDHKQAVCKNGHMWLRYRDHSLPWV